MTPETDPSGSAQERRHRHEFTALWWHFGPYGPQNVHIHSCFRSTACGDDGDCERVLVGEGRRCDGKLESHRRMTLTEEGLVTRRV